MRLREACLLAMIVCFYTMLVGNYKQMYVYTTCVAGSKVKILNEVDIIHKRKKWDSHSELN